MNDETCSPREQKHLLASSILKEGAAWTDDNIRGVYGVIQKLMWEIKLHEAYLSEIRKKISEEEKTISSTFKSVYIMKLIYLHLSNNNYSMVNHIKC